MTASAPYMPMLPRMMMHRDLQIFPAWAHPQVRYWAETWTVIRDCLLGDQEIKDKGEVYLPRMPDMDQDEYKRYLEAAVFFNMTARTINALLGTIFERTPKIEDVPSRLKDVLPSAPYNGISILSFITLMAEGVISMGRYGVLCDMPKTGGKPFLRGYDCENILDWQMDWVDGRYVPVQIILREIVEQNTRVIGQVRKYKVIYRVLSLDFDGQGLLTTASDPKTLNEIIEPVGEPVYRQYVYECADITAALNTMKPEVITPTNRGKTLNFIPFVFVGSKDNTPDIDRPPAADIARLNLAHYRTYAHLEHGRYFTAMPIYYVQVLPHSEKAEYTLGPSRVWEVGNGEKPGILEFNGQGLKSLETSLTQKEDQIAMIGGRLMGGASRSPSESDNQAKIKEANERSLLLKVIQNVEEALEKVVGWWCWWQDAPDVQPSVDLNTDFIFDQLGARELRAAHQMYVEGLIPITALHNYLMKAGLIPEWMEINQFKKLLNDMDEFPNQPDVWARAMGYSDAANRQTVLLERKQLRLQKAGQDQTGELQQQQIDVQQQLADQQGAQADHQMEMDQKQHELDKKKQEADAKAALEAVKNRNANTTPLPGQVANARGAAKASKP